MNFPNVTVVIETVTSREDTSSGSLALDLQSTLDGLRAQTYPAEQIDTVVVVDDEIPAASVAEIRARFPFVRIVSAPARNYFSAKNAGTRAATGEYVALLDGDCTPDPDWIERLITRFEPEVGFVAGATKYAGGTAAAKTFSIPDFAYVAAVDGEATGFNLNNLAARRSLLREHPLNERIRRNGGCFLLFHQLKKAGVRVLYEPRAMVTHALDVGGLGFFAKHFGRGFDGVSVYRCDQSNVLRGSRLFRTAGPLILPAIYLRRLVLDWVHLSRHRRHMRLSLLALPYFASVAVLLRSIEFLGATAAMVLLSRRSGERKRAA
jgi:glycosyltransferase involved in cell wall biosynthesis